MPDKSLVCYVIWNKHDMMLWICSGIKKSFTPDQVDLYFLLDNPIDGTDILFEDGTIQELLPDFNIKWTYHYANPLEQFKFHLQNIGMKYGLENGYEWVICPQDDQKIEDPFLLQNLKRFIREGLVGGRDGFDKLNYKDGSGSLFSHPIGEGYTWLKNGDFKSVTYLNDGPLCYHKSTIEKVGYHDLGFKVFLSELDYCRRCEALGLKNHVLGMSIVHEKFGTLRSNVYLQKHNYSEQDSNYFRSKWPD